MEDKEVNDVLSLLRKSERLGERVLRDREEIVQMDRIRNKNREALNAIKRKPQDESVYLCVGNMFFKHKIKAACELIQDDQKQVNDHIETLRRKIKDNVQQIQEMEDKSDEFSKFNITPLSPSEMNSFNVLLGSIKKMQL